MNIPVIAFFNNKGGVGTTSMAYHLAWMLSDRGLRVIAADLDPQSNLTAAFLEQDRLEAIMWHNGSSQTLFGAVKPLQQGTGDVLDPHVEMVSERLGLLPGDLRLSTFENDLSEAWPKCLGGDARAFRMTSAFWRVATSAGQRHGANVILIDLGPNLGAINRAALIASDFIVVPLGPDLFSLQGLQNLGPALRSWREGWAKRLGENPPADLPLPRGSIQPLGYIVLRRVIRFDRPVSAFERWIGRMPATYANAVLKQEPLPGVTINTDPHCIASLRDYRGLLPLAEEAGKPMFFLKPADGALGAHMLAVSDAYKDFKNVAIKIASKAGLPELT